ncbi:hypothetical protein PTKIN_Ptkin01aG0368400 [Pterospermum kingtungense]
MDALETMKAELEMMREEKLCMEALLRAAESAVEEKKRVVSEYKAMKKLADDLLGVVLEEAEGSDNVRDNNGQSLDEETMKGLIEEAMRDFAEALKKWY